MVSLVTGQNTKMVLSNAMLDRYLEEQVSLSNVGTRSSSNIQVMTRSILSPVQVKVEPQDHSYPQLPSTVLSLPGITDILTKV